MTGWLELEAVGDGAHSAASTTESFQWAAGICLASALSQAGKHFKRSYKKLETPCRKVLLILVHSDTLFSVC